MKTLETERLSLRQLALSDAEELFRIQSKGDTMRFLGGESVSVDEIRRLIDLHSANCVRTGLGMRAVILRCSGEMIGRGGLFESVVDGVPEIEISYLVDLDSRGKGIATELATALVEHARVDLRLKRLVALIDAENAASIRVAENAGFRFERERREIGEFGKVSIYSLALG